MNEQDAVEVLTEIHEVLDTNQIRYWLDYGTLLGAVRDRQFIPWDGDIDLSLLYHDALKLLQAIPKFKRKGFFVNVHCNNVTLIRDGIAVTIAAFQLHNQVYIHINYPEMTQWQTRFKTFYDFACHRKLQSMEPTIEYALAYLMSATTPSRWLTRQTSFLLWKWSGGQYFGYAVPRHFFDNLDTIQFYNMRFHTPSSIEAYLAFKYGDWQTPRRDWNISEDDGALVKGSQFKERFGRWFTLRDLIKGRVDP